MLICVGGAGILLSPSIGMRGGTELRSFSRNDVRNTETATTIITSQFELPYIQNRKGLAFMNGLIAASLLSLFSGVHLYSLLQRRAYA